MLAEIGIPVTLYILVRMLEKLLGPDDRAVFALATITTIVSGIALTHLVYVTVAGWIFARS